MLVLGINCVDGVECVGVFVVLSPLVVSMYPKGDSQTNSDAHKTDEAVAFTSSRECNKPIMNRQSSYPNKPFA